MIRKAKRTKCERCGANVIVTHISHAPKGEGRTIIDEREKSFCVIYDGHRIFRLKGHELHSATCTMKGGDK